MSGCPAEDELSLAIGASPSVELAAHLAGCGACRARSADLARVVELARLLPIAPVPRDRVEEVRTAILAAPAPRPGVVERVRATLAWRGVAVGAGGLALVAAAAVAAMVRSTPTAPVGHRHGHVVAATGARYQLGAAGADEVVVLHDGTIAVDVTPLHPGERFRVTTADAEIEVRGTAFDAVAERGRLRDVRVRHGVVEVRPHDAPPVALRAGERWQAAEPPIAFEAVPPPPAVAPPTVPSSGLAPRPRAPSDAATAPVGPRHRVPAPPPAPSVRSAAPPAAPAVARQPEDIAYEDAWAALRVGAFDRAASGFASVVVLDGDRRLTDDASYWYAVALARAGRAEAVVALRDFTARFPDHRRVGAASAMLGWLLVETNQRAEARARFRAAEHDRDPAVRASAVAGLAALDRP